LPSFCLFAELALELNVGYCRYGAGIN